MNLVSVLSVLGLTVVISPFLAFALLGSIGILGVRCKEATVLKIVNWGLGTSFFAALGILILTFFSNTAVVPVLNLHLYYDVRHSMTIMLGIDAITLPFTVLTAALTGLVGVFSAKYLHRDSGYFRFFCLILMFDVGMHLVTMGQTLVTIFIGWEAVGLTSALLISFYNVRQEVINNSLRAFLFYRLSDTMLFLAACLTTLEMGEIIFTPVIGLNHTIASSLISLPSDLAVIVPLLILCSAMVKSAQYPFISWLPRAMEGPTPSSAIFYGGISIHAGMYMILRLTSEFELGEWFYVTVVAVGILTTVLSTLFSRVQSDMKTSLSLSAVSQVGIMFVEIGLGWRQLAIMHFIGHAILRTYQILQAGAVVHEGRGLRFLETSQEQAKKPAQSGSWLELLYCFAFDGALGLSSAGPSSVVSIMERMSLRLGKFEDKNINALCSLQKQIQIQSEKRTRYVQTEKQA
jgi:NADH-quinone oxidoreductase subunit L